jgi:hypothetical protein
MFYQNYQYLHLYLDVERAFEVVNLYLMYGLH